MQRKSTFAENQELIQQLDLENADDYDQQQSNW